jgi:hypothetical protein
MRENKKKKGVYLFYWVFGKWQWQWQWLGGSVFGCIVCVSIMILTFLCFVFLTAIG